MIYQAILKIKGKVRALQERNNVTHSYNEKIALGIVRQAKAIFYDLFVQLKDEIDKNWL